MAERATLGGHFPRVLLTKSINPQSTAYNHPYICLSAAYGGCWALFTVFVRDGHSYARVVVP